MTKSDLLDWVAAHGCTIEPLSEARARVLRIKNPSNGGTAWVDLPINDRQMRDYSVFKMCYGLGIPIPDCTEYMRGVDDHIHGRD